MFFGYSKAQMNEAVTNVEDANRKTLERIKEEHAYSMKETVQRYEDTIRKLKQDHEDAFRKFKNESEDKRVKESLELQTKTAQQILDNKKEMNEKIHALEMEKTNFKAKLEEDFYNKMSTAMNDLHVKGNASSNFIQEMALKMLDVKRDLVQIENKVG